MRNGSSKVRLLRRGRDLNERIMEFQNVQNVRTKVGRNKVNNVIAILNSSEIKTFTWLIFMWTALVSFSLEKRMSTVASLSVERRISNLLAWRLSPGLGGVEACVGYSYF